MQPVKQKKCDSGQKAEMDIYNMDVGQKVERSTLILMMAFDLCLVK